MKTPSILKALGLSYLLCIITRMAYLLENYDTLSPVFQDTPLMLILKGCFMFDTSAIMYTNGIIMLLLIFTPYFRPIIRSVVLWLYTTVNAIFVVMNLADAVYFKYTGRRTTMTIFSEFQNEDNMLKVLGAEVVNHWYLIILGIVLIVALHLIARRIIMRPQRQSFLPLRRHGVLSIVVALFFIYLAVCGMRGGFTTAVRPITISNAAQYVTRAAHAPLVLNTPFSMIRTIGKNVFKDPGYYSAEELDSIYTPIHKAPDTTRKNLNIVVLIVESFGREYIGGYNDYKGHTPFVDSLLQHSLTFDLTFANGRKSIDGMPSILSGIPRFMEPFFLTPASANKVSGLAGELGTIGYHSAFFHGAENGSMGFEAFAKATGFKEYYGRTEFNADNRFNADRDFDGTWAIWDQPFLQFYALKMSEMKQPFVTAVFTASSHHPFRIPDDCQQRFGDKTPDPNPIHKCIRYTDDALRQFFNTARRQPWFKNTIFVLTSDHTNISDHPEYATDLGVFSAPILFYDPSGNLPVGRRNCIAQQTDIMPTLLSLVGYPKPYVAWGLDLLNTPDADTWAVNHNNDIYQFLKGNYLIQFDGQNLKAIYRYPEDKLLKHNLLKQKQDDPEIKDMQQQLKAIIQSYMQRMVNNKLTL